MSENNKISDVEFEKYYPQHPLPNEIKQLPMKETVCQFCGISYLIHSEIKRLEEEIISLNKKIKSFEDLEISEKKFEKQYNDNAIELQQLRLNFPSLEEKFVQIKSERDCYQQQIVNKDDKITSLESSLSILKADREIFINTQNSFIRRIFELQKHIRSFKEEYISDKNKITNLISNNQTENAVFSSKIKTTVDQMHQHFLKSRQNDHIELNRINQELIMTKKEIAEKDGQISDDVAKYQGAIDRNRLLIQEQSNLEHKISDLLSSSTQKDEMIELLKNELVQLQSSKNQHINDVNDEITSLKSDKKQLIQSMKEMKITIQQLESSLQDQQVDEQKLRSLLEETEGQLKYCRDLIPVYEEQIKTLSKQIDSMTHESDKQLLLHKTEISQLENQRQYLTKESERLKQEMETSYGAMIHEKEHEIAQLRVNEESLKNKIDEETQNNEKRQIITKAIENENKMLLIKLEEFQKHYESKSLKFEEDCKSVDILEKEIIEKENLIDKMENDLINKNNEITNLKHMVEKECAERYELTEALGQAREQLLSLGDYRIPRVPSSLPPLNHPNSNLSSASDHKSVTISIKEKRNSLDKFGGNSKNSIISTKRKLERMFNA